MNNIKFLSACCFILLMGSCKKYDLKTLDFSVTAEQITYKAGDSVTFHFTGNPDNISFYSGEPGYKYINKDRVKAGGKPKLEFTSYRRNGNQENTLFLYASTNFNGTVDSANIYAATWKDITGRASFSTGQDFAPSGIVDLSDFATDDKPVFFAFKYVGYSGTAQRIWNIKSFDIVNIVPNESSSSICNIDNAGWLATSLKGDITWTIIAGQIYFYGPTGAATNIIPNEDWIVSKPMYLDKVFPDKAIALKNISTRMDSYTYRFNTPGTYEVSFSASNMNEKQSETVVRHLTIEITP